MSARKVNIDWDKVDKYLQAQCSGVGIASILGIHENTLYERCKSDKGMEFGAYSAIKKGEGKELLKAKQFSIAMNGNVPMAIWLGKQYLDQKDKQETDHRSSDGSLKQTTIIVNSEQDKKYLEELGKL